MTPRKRGKTGDLQRAPLLYGFPGWPLSRGAMSAMAAIALLLAALAFAPRVQAGARAHIYHRFGETEYPTTDAPVNNFKEPMHSFKDNGSLVVPLATGEEAVRYWMVFSE